MSDEEVRWLLKVIQPERTLASLAGGVSLDQDAHARLLGVPVEIYATELGRMRKEASEAAGELLADQAVASMVDRLPLRKGAKVMVFGDSLTSEPQSWAVILREMLAMRRATDGISLTISAVAAETTTDGLVRVADIINSQPDWILFLFGTNDARTQGSHPTSGEDRPQRRRAGYRCLLHVGESAPLRTCSWATVCISLWRARSDWHST